MRAILAKTPKIPLSDPTLEEHLLMGMGSAWLNPSARKNVIVLLRQDLKEKRFTITVVERKERAGFTYTPISY